MATARSSATSPDAGARPRGSGRATPARRLCLLAALATPLAAQAQAASHAASHAACPSYALVSAPASSPSYPKRTAGPARPAAIPPNDPNLTYVGRIDWTGPAPRLGWGGSAIRARFTGPAISIRVSDFPRYTSHDWLAIRIDSAPPRALELIPGPATYQLATHLPPGPHSIEIIKRTEAWRGTLSFGGLTLAQGGHLLPPAKPASFRLEFYGDSNVAGHDDTDIFDRGPARANDETWSYPAILARMFSADHHNLGWSGAGMTGQSSPLVQTIWNRTNPLSAKPPFDFSQFDADVVVINAGSNDSYVHDARAKIIPAWEDLILNHLRPAHPRAHIVLADSYGWSFIEPANYLADAIADLNTKGEHNVSWVAWPWLWGETHAVAEEQAGFANILAAHIAKALGCPAPIANTVSSFAAPGQISDGGFEIRPIGLGRATQASGWREAISGPATIAAITASADTPAHAGQRFMRLSAAGGAAAGANTATIWQAATAQAGTTYTLTAWLRADTASAANAVLRIDFRDLGQNTIASAIAHATPITPPAAGWTSYTATGTAPPGTYAALATASLTANSTAATLDVDDVALTPMH